jgi:hypothetical protein
MIEEENDICPHCNIKMELWSGKLRCWQCGFQNSDLLKTKSMSISKSAIILFVVTIGIAALIPSIFNYFESRESEFGTLIFQLVTDNINHSGEYLINLRNESNEVTSLEALSIFKTTALPVKLAIGKYDVFIIAQKDTTFLRDKFVIIPDSTLYVIYSLSQGTVKSKYIWIEWETELKKKNIAQEKNNFNGGQMNGISDTMVKIFGIIFHLLILISILLGIVFVGKLINEPSKKGETTIRALSAMGGLFLFFLSKSTGISIYDLIVEAIAMYNILFYIIAITIPAIIGYAIARYCIASLKKGEDFAMRIIILFGVLLISEFLDVYILATSQSGLLMNKGLVPNIAFTLAIIFYTIFQYQSEKK